MLGVPAEGIRLLSWGLSCGLAAVAGFFIATSTGSLSPDIMDVYLVAALLAAVVGGLGSFIGAIAGAFTLWIALEPVCRVRAYRRACRLVGSADRLR